VHTCSLACTPARGSCTHVLRRAREFWTGDPGDSREFWTGDLPGGEQAASISKTSFPRWKRRSQQYIPWRAAGDNSAPSGICRNGIGSAGRDPGSEQQRNLPEWNSIRPYRSWLGTSVTVANEFFLQAAAILAS